MSVVSELPLQLETLLKPIIDSEQEGTDLPGSDSLVHMVCVQLLVAEAALGVH
ncbi:hypothetical protein [Comamonas testosteroni]|uniref:hypothetical protein n=1 Tax=Comamonas testosteroni TaxID=285 RepID=UPI003D0C2C0A